MLAVSICVMLAATASLVSSTAIDRSKMGLETRNADCTTFRYGYLAANITSTGVLKSFTVNSEKELSYVGDRNEPLYVEFQSCASLNTPDETDELVGVIYAPEYNKCITITNQADATGPYFTKLGACNTGYPEQFLIRTYLNDSIYWKGYTDEEGTTPQGGCGLLGYDSNKNGKPITTNPEHQVPIVCGGSVFHLSQKAH